MQFPFYSEHPANTESVIAPLKEIFKGTNIRVTDFNSHDLRKGILREKDTVGFCLPGIIGETSGYSDQIGEYGLHEMSRAVEQGGVKLDGETVTDFKLELAPTGGERVLQVGRRKVLRL